MARTPDKPTGQDARIQVELLEPQRKQPRQPRSVMLVSALKLAGRNILDREGREALTLQRLSECAGVAVSSIYEYFSTLDTLVAAIFDDYRLQAYADMMDRLHALPASATLFDGIVLVVEETVRMRQWELDRDREVAIKRLQYGELQRLDMVRPLADIQARATRELVARFAAQVQIADLEKALFMNIQMMQAMVRIIAIERPEYLGERDTLLMLARMLHSMFTTGAEKS